MSFQILLCGWCGRRSGPHHPQTFDVIVQGYAPVGAAVAAGAVMPLRNLFFAECWRRSRQHSAKKVSCGGALPHHPVNGLPCDHQKGNYGAASLLISTLCGAV